MGPSRRTEQPWLGVGDERGVGEWPNGALLTWTVGGPLMGEWVGWGLDGLAYLCQTDLIIGLGVRYWAGGGCAGDGLVGGSTGRWVVDGLSQAALLVGVVVLVGLLAALVGRHQPAGPSVMVVNAGGSGLAVITGASGRRVVVGGGTRRLAVDGALDRWLWPWQRSVDLLLVPPPHDRHLAGALGMLERRAVGRASLLGLAAEANPLVDAWQAGHPAAPVVGLGRVQLDQDTWLVLETGADSGAREALVTVERGDVRIVLMAGDGAQLTRSRLTAGGDGRAMVVIRLDGAGDGLDAEPVAPLVVDVDRGQALATAPTCRTVRDGEAVRLTLATDSVRCRVLTRLGQG